MNSLKEQIAKNANVTVRYVEYLLNGQRDPSVHMARVLESVSGVPKEIWAFGSKDERQNAFKNIERSRCE